MTGGGRRGALAGCGALLLVTALALSRTLGHGFVNWDDPHHITANPLIRELDLRALFRVPANQIFHPLAMLSWALEYRFVGLEPRLYRIDNLLLHLVNVALVLRLVARLVPERRALRWLVAGVFALHPLQVEAVAWATARKDLLCTALTLASWLSWLRFRAQPGAERALGWYLLALAAFALALFAKPMAIALPALLWLGDLFGRRAAWWRSAAELAPFAAVAAGYGLSVPLTIPAGPDTSQLPLYGLGPLARLGLVFEGVVFYLSKFLWPARLAIFYDVAALRLTALDFARAGGFALGLALWLWRRPADRRLALGAALYFLVSWAPVSKLVPFSGNSLYNDRYLYLPILGLAALASLPLLWLLERSASRGAARIVCALLGALLALGTHQRSRVWESSLTLWQDVLANHPQTAIAEHQIGVYWIEEGGDLARALAAFEAATRIDPRFTQSWLRQGLVLAELGEPARAAAALERAVASAPNDAHTRGVVATFHLEAGNYERAVAHYEAALRIAPGHPKLENDLGTALLRMGRHAQARAAFERALAAAGPEERARIRANLARVDALAREQRER